MTIRADSYSTAAEVTAFTRHLLAGQSAFNSTTRPTVTELDKFIDRASGILNSALVGSGLAAPITNSTAKLACDDWVTARSAEYVELTQRGVGYSEGEGSRTASFRNMAKSANQFVTENRLGFVRLGVTVSHGKAEGLAFTGLDARSERDDPDDTALVQPFFRRGKFDDPSATESDSEDEI
jgi:hypothetical protein